MPDHGKLFDNFSAAPSHTHGGSYFDAGFGLQTLRDAHGKLYDLFGASKGTSEKHGARYDEFGWEAMPAIHGQQFDTDFATPAANDGKHGTWFDVFRGGTKVRFMADGIDYEGTVIECAREYAKVRSSDGQEHEVGLSQFLSYRTPNEQQASPTLPASGAEAPSAHSADAHGAFRDDRAPVPTNMPPVVQEVPHGQNTEPRSGMPAGLMDTFTHLKSLAAEMDVEKDDHPGVATKGTPTNCLNCGTTLHPKRETVVLDGKHAHVQLAHCPTCGLQHTGPPVEKTVDTTETAAQAQDLEGADSHRRNCPEGGSGPCGADKDGKCSKCGAGVRDHEAVGKATTGDLGITVPDREHPDSDHHMKLGAKPGRCPHCGAVLNLLDEKTEQGAPTRAHKCAGTGVDVLKQLGGLT